MPAITIESISKCYQIYSHPRHRLWQMLCRGRKQFYQEFWALKDISFEIKQGETWGIIGKNGSGKSTLLQILCGTLYPTHGTVHTKGRIAALLELGSGFNPEFTGIENIFMNCAIHGFTHEQTQARLDDITAFADIGNFIEQPVKTYSSGMFVRLAFAVNIMLDPDILIVDEALAVGDMAFQAKCMTAMRRIQDNGASLLFVSHDLNSVTSLCSHAIHLENGQIKNRGRAADIAPIYLKLMREEMNAEHQTLKRDTPQNSHFSEHDQPEIEVTANHLSHHTPEFKTCALFDQKVSLFRYGNGEAKVTFVELLDTEGHPITSADFDQEVKIRIYFCTYVEGEAVPSFYIMDQRKNLVMGGATVHFGWNNHYCRKNGCYIATFSTKLPLVEGNYSIRTQVNRPVIWNVSAEFLDVIDDAIVFTMRRRQSTRVWAHVLLPGKVDVTEI